MDPVALGQSVCSLWKGWLSGGLVEAVQQEDLLAFETVDCSCSVAF